MTIGKKPQNSCLNSRLRTRTAIVAATLQVAAFDMTNLAQPPRRQ